VQPQQQDRAQAFREKKSALDTIRAIGWGGRGCDGSHAQHCTGLLRTARALGKKFRTFPRELQVRTLRWPDSLTERRRLAHEDSVTAGRPGRSVLGAVRVPRHPRGARAARGDRRGVRDVGSVDRAARAKAVPSGLRRRDEGRVSPSRRPCLQPGCRRLTEPGQSRCQVHPIKGWSNRAGSMGSDWSRIRAEVLRAEPRCRSCGARATTVDHSSRGRSAEPTLGRICSRCVVHATGGRRKPRPSRAGDGSEWSDDRNSGSSVLPHSWRTCDTRRRKRSHERQLSKSIRTLRGLAATRRSVD